MTAIQLYRFITENKIEYHWHEDDVILMPNISELKEFSDLLGCNITDDDGIKCTMKYGYFCFYMREICDYFGIELTEIFKKE